MIDKTDMVLAKGKNLDRPIHNVFDGYAFMIENGIERSYPRAVFQAYKDVLSLSRKKAQEQEDKTPMEVKNNE